MNRKSALQLCLLLFTLLPASLLVAQQQAFNTDSMAAITDRYTRQPFLLVVWSIECPPCRDELELLGKLKKVSSQFNLVLVATDDISQQAVLDPIIAEYQLAQSDSWAFADSNSEKLRYSLDPDWFGEMPRSYFYDAAHQRIGISGKLNRQTILEWLKAK